MSSSAMYLSTQLATRLTLSSPSSSAMVRTCSSAPSLYATSPFCEKFHGNLRATPAPSCSSCLGRSLPPTIPTVTSRLSAVRNPIICSVISPRGTVRVLQIGE